VSNSSAIGGQGGSGATIEICSPTHDFALRAGGDWCADRAARDLRHLKIISRRPSLRVKKSKNRSWRFHQNRQIPAVRPGCEQELPHLDSFRADHRRDAPALLTVTDSPDGTGPYQVSVSGDGK
jgi:hypothetical protein